jgi:hypothetical protein
MTAHKTMFVPINAIQMSTTVVTDAGGWASNTINPIDPARGLQWLGSIQKQPRR